MPNPARTTRRQFLKRSAGAAAVGSVAPYFFTGRAVAQETAKNDRLIVGAIGVGGRGSGVAKALSRYGDMVAVCDVDRNHAERFKGESNMEIYEDYRKLLDRQDIQAVTIGTPDHWHTPILLYAIKAGKDVYCEKPMTLTIDEGKIITEAMRDSKQIVQIGTQQRSEFDQRFLQAVAMARSGKLGKIKTVTAMIGGSPKGGPFNTSEPPEYLNWDFWLGQTPKVPYIKERCHGDFRWWYEYSGGKMTDWGAHHVDIAQWAIGAEETGPVRVEGTATHPVPLKNGYPEAADQFNAATAFRVSCKFADEVELVIQHEDNGVLIEGSDGVLFASRGKISGAPVEAVLADEKQKEWLAGEIEKLTGGPPRSHMADFIAAVKSRKQPVSDVFTHHRSLTTCHLANIAIRLGRKITWDPEKQEAVGDEEINSAWLKRPQREGYEFGSAT